MIISEFPDPYGFCNRPGCPEPLINGSHYHCGACNSPQITSMLGHSMFGELTCDMSANEIQALIERNHPRKDKP